MAKDMGILQQRGGMFHVDRGIHGMGSEPLAWRGSHAAAICAGYNDIAISNSTLITRYDFYGANVNHSVSTMNKLGSSFTTLTYHPLILLHMHRLRKTRAF